MTKKGIELPGKEGRWEEADECRSERRLAFKRCGSDKDANVLPAGRYVVYRRIEEKPAMPELRPWMAVQLKRSCRLVLIECHLESRPRWLVAVDDRGNRCTISPDSVVRVWENGKCIWAREDEDDHAGDASHYVFPWKP